MDKQLLLNGEKGRLDKVLSELFPEKSRATLQKWIKQRLVLVNGEIQKANYQLSGDELLEIKFSDIKQSEKMDIFELEGENIPLSIVYEDESILVIDKPKGMVVHPSKGHHSGTLVNGLIYYLGNSISHESDNIRPGLVHRIDKDTSGLLVIAKDDESHHFLSQQLEGHQMERTYVALVNGNVKENSGKIEVPLRRDSHNRLRWAAHPEGKYALTHFKVIERFKGVSLLQLNLETGRTHQIRVHMEFIGHPIVGDPVYRKGLHHTHSPLSHYHEGQFLHAQTLKLLHPKTKEEMVFTTSLPEDFQLLLASLQ